VEVVKKDTRRKMMIQTISNTWKCVAALAVVGMMAAPGVASAASVVSEVVAKYIDATGGREAQEAIKSAIIRLNLTIPEFGVQMETTAYYKDGDFKSVTGIPNMGEVIQGVTDGVAWQMNPMEGNKILEGQAAESLRQATSLNPLLYWQEIYVSAEILGEEGGATMIKFISDSGNADTYHFDNESGLITKQKGTGPDGGTVTRTFNEYKKVGVITFPYKASVETAQANLDFTVATVELNAEIDDGAFELPPEIRAQLPEEPGAGFSAEQLMAFLDTNGDGKIAKDEVNRLMISFEGLDKNADGEIDAAEAGDMANAPRKEQTLSPQQATGAVTPEQLMAFMDTNSDGKITMEEAPEELKAGFSFIDANGDGGIDLNEAQAMADYANNENVQSTQPQPTTGAVTAEQLMALMDTNSDGKITMEEAPEELKAGFSFIDANGNGGIDLKEAQVMADYANNENVQSTQPQPTIGAVTAEQLMAFMDTNSDGKITMEEAPEEVKAGFSFIDANGDGGIDLKEAQVMAEYANNQ
jgi:Ca2+-binding EF-hand superfamily protein